MDLGQQIDTLRVKDIATSTTGGFTTAMVSAEDETAAHRRRRHVQLPEGSRRRVEVPGSTSAIGASSGAQKTHVNYCTICCTIPNASG